MTLGNGMRVLIVDDERDTVMTLGILLRSEGFEVQQLQAGASVPAKVRDFRPSAVLLDIGMPDCNGYQLAGQLTKEHGPACPVLVAITGRSSDADRQLARRTGFRHYVLKPYDPDQLLRLLGSLSQQAA